MACSKGNDRTRICKTWRELSCMRAFYAVNMLDLSDLSGQSFSFFFSNVVYSLRYCRWMMYLCTFQQFLLPTLNVLFFKRVLSLFRVTHIQLLAFFFFSLSDIWVFHASSS